MALKAELQVITEPGATGNVTYNTAAGFGTPAAIIVWGTAQNADGTLDNATLSVGFATDRGGTASQRCWAMSTLDADTADNPSSRMTNAAVWDPLIPGSTAVDAQAALVSFADEEYVLNWIALSDLGSQLVNVLILGGDDITDAYAFDFALGTTDPQDVDVIAGFGQPDVILFLAPPWDAFGTVVTGTSTEGGIGFGAGIKDGTTRATTYIEDNGSASMEVTIWQQSAVILQQDQATTTTEDTEVTLAASSGWPTDGFELTLTNPPAASVVVCALALKGDFAKAMSARTTPTAAPTVNSDYDVSFTPRAALCWGGNIIPAAGATSPQSTGAGQFWIGATDGTTEAFAGISQETAAADADTYQYRSTAKTVRMHQSTDAALLLEADGSFTGTTFRLAYNDTDATSREFNALVLGETAAVTQSLLYAPPRQANLLYSR